MARNYAHPTEERAPQTAIYPGWRSLFYLAATFLIGWAGLFSGISYIGPGRLFWQFCFHVFFVLFLERALSRTHLSRTRVYRLAFLVSFSLAGVFFISTRLPQNPPLPPESLAILLLAAAFGSFIGSILSTGINDCFWENNAPPSLQVQEEVYLRHRETIGEAFSGSPAKRGFDILLSLLGLVLSSPVWLLITFLVWMEDPGPVLFVKNSVGRGGKNFHQFKFRTMIREAENGTGPILSKEGDERVLLVGRFLRKTALDELPQLLNILMGDMSFVGPRPQRTILVKDYLVQMPEYANRHQVRPGLAGLAQVAGDYYLTPRQKLRFDRLYIQYASLGFDLKLIGLAFLLVFWFRWQKDWNGRLPRNLVRLGRI